MFLIYDFKCIITMGFGQLILNTMDICLFDYVLY